MFPVELSNGSERCYGRIIELCWLSLSSGLSTAQEQEVGATSIAHPLSLVAQMIVNLIRTGDEEADLVPREYGGSFEG
ncbi:hypothetical protein GCM10009022_23200 [Vreelandella titanicae]